jgi:hypothetical protein
MLRRNPTTIALTQADLDLYEANRQRKLWEKQQQQASSQSTESSEKTQEKEQGKKERILGDRRN